MLDFCFVCITHLAYIYIQDEVTFEVLQTTCNFVSLYLF